MRHCPGSIGGGAPQPSRRPPAACRQLGPKTAREAVCWQPTPILGPLSLRFPSLPTTPLTLNRSHPVCTCSSPCMHALPLRPHSFCMTAPLHPTASPWLALFQRPPASSRRRPPPSTPACAAAALSCSPRLLPACAPDFFFTDPPFDCSARYLLKPAVMSSKQSGMSAAVRRRPTLRFGPICMSDCSSQLLSRTIAATGEPPGTPLQRSCPRLLLGFTRPARSRRKEQNPAAQPVAVDPLHHHSHPTPSKASQQRCARPRSLASRSSARRLARLSH